MKRLDLVDFDRTIGRVEVFSEGVVGSLVEQDHITEEQQADIREAEEKKLKASLAQKFPVTRN